MKYTITIELPDDFEINTIGCEDECPFGKEGIDECYCPFDECMLKDAEVSK